MPFIRRRAPAPLADNRVLELAGTRLAELTGEEWRVQDGPLLKGPGSAGVRVGPRHDDSFRHVDLEFLLNVDRDETSLPDCSNGLAADPEQATRQAVAAWAATTASVALEMLTQESTYATHLKPGTPEGFPGWHAIIGGVANWGSARTPAQGTVDGRDVAVGRTRARDRPGPGPAVPERSAAVRRPGRRLHAVRDQDQRRLPRAVLRRPRGNGLAPHKDDEHRQSLPSPRPPRGNQPLTGRGSRWGRAGPAVLASAVLPLARPSC